jgi:hypothetical protein
VLVISTKIYSISVEKPEENLVVYTMVLPRRGESFIETPPVPNFVCVLVYKKRLY